MRTKQLPQHHLVLGIAGTSLSSQEIRWLRKNRPTGIILFSRNIENLPQVSALIASISDNISPTPTIWIDQEGGRVQRLRAPFTNFPSPNMFAQLFRNNPTAGLNMARLGGRVCGEELSSIGIGVNCAPVLDIQQQDADPVIGNRAFGSTAEEIIQLAGAWIAGLTASGVMAVGKHFPGHGAAQVDSHKSLPTINKSRQALEQHELLPFKALAGQLPAMMTAHLVAVGLDPTQPASWSQPILKNLLRTDWNYRGLIVSDAVEMGALAGTISDRVYHSLLGGCDLVLCCTGNMEDNEAALEGAITGIAQMNQQDLESSRQRIETILAPYRQPPKRQLNDSYYLQARKQLEMLATNKTEDDPTEAG